jgi:Xaa-Pro aminopeptidase
MRKILCAFALAITFTAQIFAAPAADDQSNLRDRRQRAAAAFHDGILLIHANVPGDFTEDGFRQDPIFYYFTGLENTANAVLAIDGPSGESWLFLPPSLPFPYPHMGFKPEILPGSDAANRLGIEHVLDWSQLQDFLAKRAASPTRLYLAPGLSSGVGIPENFTGEKLPDIPLWAQWIRQRWPSFELVDAYEKTSDLLSVQDATELLSVRAAAKSTVSAVLAGMRAIAPDKSQRTVEAAVESACWNAGAHGSSFWPWAMSGENAVFPRPFAAETRYDHLNSVMRAGDLVRLDVGCEWNHYQGDLGRTIPVSGHFTDEQRETWNIFIAAYHAGSKALREGVTVNQVFDAWRAELVSHQSAAKSPLAQHAIEQWSKRENVPFWQVHTINLVAGNPKGPLRANTTIAFEPIASVDGQGYYLEDMFLITKDGAELLTPGVPYTAEEIEAAMR